MNGIKNKTIRGKKFSSLEQAYIAGLVDGEGCINIYRINTKKVPKWILSISIYNCDFNILNWLYKRRGGYLQKRGKRKKKWKQNYAWKISANDAMEFLQDIKKYLRIKKRQAELAIKFQTKQSRRLRGYSRIKGTPKKIMQFRINAWLQMKKLNSEKTSPAETERNDA